MLRTVFPWLGGCVLLGCAMAHGPSGPTPPAESEQLPPCPSSPNCVSSTATDPAHYVDPLLIVGPPGSVMSELERIVRAMPRARVVSSTGKRIRAEFTSLVFRFIDDVDLLLDAPAGVVHVRSASRVGYSDLGVNRRRVESIRKALAAATGSEPGSRLPR